MADRRFEAVRHLNLAYDVSYIRARYTRLELWQERAAELREQVLVSAGLMPMPERAPLDAHIFGRVERDGYSVEKVHFQSLPGVYVAGNLYRPLVPGRHPGILNPHGHWKEGRLQNDDTCSVPGRCINFAKRGYVALSWDMADYVDSRQWEHRRWNLRDRLWGLSTGGLQLWNSIRALDFIQSLPDVDPGRIACTGASGGGTQTFLLCAVDERVSVSAPVNMISAHMQGGCVCENLPGLRIDTDNVEIAALTAPRPMLMVSAAGDWTKNTLEIEFPAVRHIYGLFCAEDRLEAVRVDAGHNYNKQSREAVYSFFGKWLPGNTSEAAQSGAELPFDAGDAQALRVFADGMPADALDTEGIARYWRDCSERQYAAFSADPGAFESAYRPALARALALPARLDVGSERLSDEADVDIIARRVVIKERSRGAEIPAVVVEPADVVARKAVVVADGHGPKPFMESGAVRRLVENGWRVIAVQPPVVPERDIEKDFFDTYNRTLLQERVYEAAAAAKWARERADKVALVGTGEGGAWCLLAAPFAEGVSALAVQEDYKGIEDERFVKDFYAPGIRRAGDFRAAEALVKAEKLIGFLDPLIAAKWLMEM